MRRFIISFFAVFLIELANAETSESMMLPEQANLHIFLLTGQSNMAGRGELDEASQATDSRILALGKEGEWVVAEHPLHYDKPIAGVGLAMSFAREYVKDHPGVTVGLVPAACGGSPISSWKPGAHFEQTNSNPYDDAIARANRALQDGVLKGILWHQGESDSHEGLSAVYEGELTALVKRFRAQFENESLPIVFGQLGQFGESRNEHMLAVENATMAVAKADPNIAFANSDGLGSKGDDVHFSSDALREFGRRYYLAYKSIAD